MGRHLEELSVMTDAFSVARLGEIQAQKEENAERRRRLCREMEELEAAEIALHQQFIRAQNFDPGQGACPRCSIDDGITSRLIVLTGTTEGSARRCSRCAWTVTDREA